MPQFPLDKNPFSVDLDELYRRVVVTGSGSASLTGTETLTNKTLSAPTISNPLINNAVLDAAASTLALSQASHDGKTIKLNRSAGIACTLPAATGSGFRIRLVVVTALSAANYTVAVANSSDYMRGTSFSTQDAADTALMFDTADTGTVATESDTITLNGTTTGGVVGTIVELEDIAANLWVVRITNKASGAEATPFSVAV